MSSPKELIERELTARGRISGNRLTPMELLLRHRVTPKTVMPPLMPLLCLFGEPCFYRGELVAVCGKAKSGKTLFLSLLMAQSLAAASPTDGRKSRMAALRRMATTADPSPGDERLKVLWIDTEQSAQSTQDILKNRILPLTGASPRSSPQAEDSDFDNRFFAFNLRGMGYEVRRQLVETAVCELKPDLAIIDGIKDLMTDINDAVQATMLMEQLMALAQKNDTCVVCVLHQNKSEADHNMRGSIGTELTNKAFEVFQCEYEEDADLFKVKQKLSRRQHIRQKLYYRLDGNGLPVECANYQEQPRDAQGRWVKSMPDLRKLFTNAMEGRTQRPYNEVMGVSLKKLGVSDPKTYYAYLEEAVAQGIVRVVMHPDTKANWVELCDNLLPF